MFLYIERTDKLPVKNQSIHVFVITQVEVDGKLLDIEASFCYLGDMLCAGGGCVLPITTRCSTACGKFQQTTSKHVSPLTFGKVFNTCVPSALLHGSET